MADNALMRIRSEESPTAYLRRMYEEKKTRRLEALVANAQGLHHDLNDEIDDEDVPNEPINAGGTSRTQKWNALMSKLRR